MTPATAQAHPSEAATAASWETWHWDPLLWLALAGPTVMYGLGGRALWRSAGRGRGLRRWQVACFGLGMLALVAALASPIDGLALALFSAHMVQHLLLILVAAPLLAMGTPVVAWLWALPVRWRRHVACWWRRASAARRALAPLLSPVVVWVIHTAVVWVWHVPVLYQAALLDETVHALEHLFFLATAVLFWSLAVPSGTSSRLNGGVATLYLFAAAMQGSLLGALMTFSQQAWYPAYAESTAAWGMEPLADQQLGGLIMWIPAGLVYLGAAGALFWRWLEAEERQERRRHDRTNHAATADSGLNPAHGPR